MLKVKLNPNVEVKLISFLNLNFESKFKYNLISEPEETPSQAINQSINLCYFTII